MIISLRLNEKDASLIKKYAEINNITISELVRQSVIEKIEDEYDLSSFNKTYSEYKNDKETYSLNDVKKELGLWFIVLHLQKCFRKLVIEKK